MGRSRFLSSRVPGTVGSTKSINFMTDLTPLLGGVLDEGRTSSSAGLSGAPALAADRRDRSTSAMACQHDRVRLLRAHLFHKVVVRLSLAKTSSDSVRSTEIRQSVHRPRPRAWLEVRRPASIDR